jgi:hypothetical protein
VIWRLCSVIALVCAIACASSNSQDAGPMEIELDVFSGRPNPRWVASPERAASVSAALSSLAVAPARPEPGHLGYRGFIVRQREIHARVYDGHVFVTANGTTRTFVDSAGLEKQLIDDARERGFGDAVRK